MSLFIFPGGGGAAAGLEMRYLQKSAATVVGTDWWTQASDTITGDITVPASSVTTLGGATGCPSFLVWPLGPLVGATGNLTVADIAVVRLEMEIISLPATNDVRILLPFGVVASTATDPADVVFATDKSRWASVYSGSSGATPGTTVANSAQNNNLSPATGASSKTTATRLVAECGFTLRGSIYEADSYSLVLDASAPARSNNSNGDDYTATWNLFAFLAGGRATTSGATQSPQIKLLAGALRRSAP